MGVLQEFLIRLELIIHQEHSVEDSWIGDACIGKFIIVLLFLYSVSLFHSTALNKHLGTNFEIDLFKDDGY